MNDSYFFKNAQDYNRAKDLVFTYNPVIYYKVFWCGLRQNAGYCVEGLFSLSSDEMKWLVNILKEFDTSSSNDINQIAKSAQQRSTYVFEIERDYNNAKEAIYYWDSSVYNNNDKIYFYGYWGGEYRIDLYDELTATEAEKVASIIREHRGQFVPNP